MYALKKVLKKEEKRMIDNLDVGQEVFCNPFPGGLPLRYNVTPTQERNRKPGLYIIEKVWCPDPARDSDYLLIEAKNDHGEKFVFASSEIVQVLDDYFF